VPTYEYPILRENESFVAFTCCERGPENICLKTGDNAERQNLCASMEPEKEILRKKFLFSANNLKSTKYKSRDEEKITVKKE
jgi:hypothetical protein